MTNDWVTNTFSGLLVSNFLSTRLKEDQTNWTADRLLLTFDKRLLCHFWHHLSFVSYFGEKISQSFLSKNVK